MALFGPNPHALTPGFTKDAGLFSLLSAQETKWSPGRDCKKFPVESQAMLIFEGP